jgi:Domain of unknown function (DUF6647)
MLKALACCLTLLAIAIGGPADAQPSANGTHSTDQHDVTLSGSNYEEVVVGMAKLPKLAGSSGQALLTAMETWVSSQFDLPAIHEHPRIEFAPPAKIASLRFTDLLSDPGAQVEPNNRASSAQHDTIAIYDDATRTIYLPEGWTGGTPAELSVLVHELVHHFQNVLGLKHECPQEREKLAYIAQDRWLGLFGHSLADDFALDPFSLFVKTTCFY